jgi:hypothetical protein
MPLLFNYQDFWKNYVDQPVYINHLSVAIFFLVGYIPSLPLDKVNHKYVEGAMMRAVSDGYSKQKSLFRRTEQIHPREGDMAGIVSNLKRATSDLNEANNIDKGKGRIDREFYSSNL